MRIKVVEEIAGPMSIEDTLKALTTEDAFLLIGDEGVVFAYITVATEIMPTVDLTRINKRPLYAIVKFDGIELYENIYEVEEFIAYLDYSKTKVVDIEDIEMQIRY